MAVHVHVVSQQIKISVPARLGNSLYTFPGAPTAGFERDITSLVGARTTSTPMGCTLRVSLTSITNRGIVSKSSSPLTLIPFSVSLIFVRNRSWN